MSLTAPRVPRETEGFLLAKLEAARLALAAARHLPEVKQVRDRAAALRQYAPQQRKSLVVQNQAAEITLRAARRAGALLAGMEKAAGGDAQRTRWQHVTASPPTLAALGVTKRESHRWQQIAALPEPTFEASIPTTTMAHGAELTTAG